MFSKKVVIFIDGKKKVFFSEIMKFIETSVVIPYSLKERIKEQILKSYRKDKTYGQIIKLDKKCAKVFYAAYATVTGKPVNDYSFLYEYDNVNL